MATDEGGKKVAYDCKLKKQAYDKENAARIVNKTMQHRPQLATPIKFSFATQRMLHNPTNASQPNQCITTQSKPYNATKAAQLNQRLASAY